ncbi:MAG: LacI family DNA-binding transcriptional regulator [Terrisporobacter sp.]
MKVTIKDVAKEADVAVSTVSRVISNSSKISAKTKLKVWEAIKKLDYTPNQMARSLATQRTNILAVVLPQDFGESFSNPFFMQTLKGMSSCAKERGYFIMFAFREGDDNWIKRFVQSNFVEGIMLFQEEKDNEIINYLKDIEFPFVSLILPENTEDYLKIDKEEDKNIHEANGKYLGNYATKTIMDKLENKDDKNHDIINIKFIEKESTFEKMKSMILYNRDTY